MLVFPSFSLCFVCNSLAVVFLLLRLGESSHVSRDLSCSTFLNTVGLYCNLAEIVTRFPLIDVCLLDCGSCLPGFFPVFTLSSTIALGSYQFTRIYCWNLPSAQFRAWQWYFPNGFGWAFSSVPFLSVTAPFLFAPL